MHYIVILCDYFVLKIYIGSDIKIIHMLFEIKIITFYYFKIFINDKKYVLRAATRII